MRIPVSWPVIAAVAVWLVGGSPVPAQAPGSFVAGPGTSGEWAVAESPEDLLLVQLLPAGRAWVAWLDHEEDGEAPQCVEAQSPLAHFGPSTRFVTRPPV